MKPKAEASSRLRIQSHKSINHNSKVTTTVARTRTNEKNRQLHEAVKRCSENKARGGSALKTGLFPLIKDRQTINRRLDGKVAIGGEREYCKILTFDDSDRARRGFSFGQLLKQKYDVTWNPGVPIQTKMEKITVILSTVKYILYIVKRRRVWIFYFFFYVKGPDEIWMLKRLFSLKK